jgi:23S rRNA (uracil1939-C5)-methyltransferase
MGRRPHKRKIAPEMVIEGLHPEGRFWGVFSGRRVYIPGAIPGELADVEVTYGGQAFLEGNIIRLLKPHPARQVPFCKHAGVCGGCVFQHIAYEHQLNLKKQLLEDAFARKGISTGVLKEVMPSQPDRNYRNRLEFSFSNRRWFYDNEGKVESQEERLAVGFSARGLPGRVVDITECHIGGQEAVALARFAREIALEEGVAFYDFKTGEGELRSIEVLRNSAGKLQVVVGFAHFPSDAGQRFLNRWISCSPQVGSWYGLVWNNPFKADYPDFVWHLAGDTFLHENYNQLYLRYSLGGFSQANLFLAPSLFRFITEQARVEPGMHAIDLYCGSGVIGLHLAREGAKVIGIEGNPIAVEDATFNARNNGLNNCTFIQGDVLATFNQAFLATHGSPDVIVLDPPRSGTLKEILKTIISSGVKRVIYVSCNPQALARDLQMLISYFDLEVIQPFDMFPHTPHLETVAVMSRQ